MMGLKIRKIVIYAIVIMFIPLELWGLLSYYQQPAIEMENNSGTLILKSIAPQPIISVTSKGHILIYSTGPFTVTDAFYNTAVFSGTIMVIPDDPKQFIPRGQTYRESDDGYIRHD